MTAAQQAQPPRFIVIPAPRSAAQRKKDRFIRLRPKVDVVRTAPPGGGGPVVG